MSTKTEEKSEDGKNVSPVENGVNTDNQKEGDIQIGKEERESKMDTEETEEAEEAHGEFTVFVGKLSAKVTEERLKEHFKAAGEIMAVSMPWKSIMKTKRYGFAFVDFADKEAYKAALKMDQSELDGQAILVLPTSKTHLGFLAMQIDDEKPEEKESVEKKSEEKKPEEEKPEDEKSEEKKSEEAVPFVPVYKKSEYVAYIKNVPHGTSEIDVLKFFGMTREEVVDLAVIYPLKSKRKVNKPVRAIIAFKTEEDLEKALSKTNTKLNDQEVTVERHTRGARPEKRPATEGQDGDATASKQAKTTDAAEKSGATELELDLFVKQIPKEATHKHIRDFFSCSGAHIKKISLFEDTSTGTSRGMGFLTMANKTSLQKGLLMDGKRFFKNKVRVSIRRDREHLSKPEKTEATFTTFISNLPPRKRFETVRTALLEFLEKNGVKVKSVNVPAYPNRPGNKGFAFVVLEDAASLKKTHSLTNSEVFIYDRKYTIVVTDRWPESPLEPAARSMLRDRKPPLLSDVAPRTPVGLNQDRWFPENRGPRGSGQLPPVWESDPRRAEANFRGGDFPANLQSRKDYEDYMSYLEYREYMTMRNALAEKEEVIRRYRDREEALQQRFQGQLPTSVDAIAELLLGRSAALLRKDETLRSTDSFGDAFTSSGRSGLDSTIAAGAAASLAARRDYPEIPQTQLPQEELRRDRILSNSGLSGGDDVISALLAHTSNVTVEGIGGRPSDSFASLNSSRYQTANESTLARSRLDSSAASLGRDSQAFSVGGPAIDQRRVAELEAKYGSVRDQYGSAEDQYGSVEDKYGSDRDKYGSSKYGSTEDKYGSSRDKYGSDRDKYGSNKYGSSEDKYRSAKSSPASRGYWASPSADYARRAGGSSGQSERRSGSSAVDKSNLVINITNPAGCNVKRPLNLTKTILCQGKNLNKSM